MTGTVFHELRDFLVPAENMCCIHNFALVVDDGLADVRAAWVGSAVKRLPDTAGCILQPSRTSGACGHGQTFWSA